MNVRAGSLVFTATLLLPACASAPVDGRHAKAQATDCSDYAYVPANLVHRQRLFGSERTIARAIENADWFATDCSVHLNEGPVAPRSCIPPGATEVDLQDKWLDVRKSATDGTFRMTLAPSEGGRPTYVVPNMLPAHYGAADPSKPFDALRGTDGSGRLYFVYLGDFETPDVAPHTQSLKKKYWVQVYYPTPPDTYECIEHAPSSQAENGKRTLSPPTPQPAHPRPRQGGVGGGVEPGPGRPLVSSVLD